MRTLCKKALALCVVFALALTCFVGTLSVSAADPYDATLTVADVNVKFGDTTATAVLHIAVAAPGINEAIINIDSTIGTIEADPDLDLETLVVDGGGDAYVDVVGDDFSKLFLSAREAETATDLNGILAADITVVFTLKDGVKPGTYPINIVTEGVKAADKNETVVNLVYTTVGNFIVACDHANATEDVTTAPTCTEPGVKTITCACGYTTTEPVDALGHAEELTYTSKEDGTHAVDCPNCEVAFDAEDCADTDADNACDKCGYVMEKPHEHAFDGTAYLNREDGKWYKDCECGESQETDAVVDSNMKQSASIVVRDKFGLSVGVKRDAAEAYDDFYVEFKAKRYGNGYMLEDKVYFYKYVPEGQEAPEGYEPHSKEGTSDSVIEFLYMNITAYEMSLPVEITIYGINNGKVVAKSTTATRTLAERALSKIKSVADEDKPVYIDVVNYGAAVQQYFKDDNPTSDLALTGVLPNANFGDYKNFATDDSLASVDKAVDESSLEHPNGGTTKMATNLIVDSNNQLMYTFNTSTYDKSTLKYDIIYIDSYKNDKSVSLKVEDLTPVGTNYTYIYDKVALFDASVDVVVNVYTNDTLIAVRKFSFEDYVAKKATDPDIRPIGDAMMKLCYSVRKSCDLD